MLHARFATAACTATLPQLRGKTGTRARLKTQQPQAKLVFTSFLAQPVHCLAPRPKKPGMRLPTPQLFGRKQLRANATSRVSQRPREATALAPQLTVV